MATITTSYIYTDNGVHTIEPDAFFFLGWDDHTWTITLPTAVQNVTEIDFTVMAGVTYEKTTASYSGSFFILAYDEADNLVGTLESAILNGSDTLPISDIGVMTLNNVTVKKIVLDGPNVQGPNIRLLNIVEGVTFYNITSLAPVPDMQAVMYTRAADIIWQPVNGASTYTLKSSSNGGTENTLVENTTNLSFEATKLEPGSSYTFTLYTDLDPLVASSTYSVSTLDFNTLINDIFETGDSVKVNIKSFPKRSNAKFVKLGETINFENEGSYVVPFDSSLGSGQTITMSLLDTSDIVISYDDQNNEVSAGGTICPIGGQIIVSGKKMSAMEIV